MKPTAVRTATAAARVMGFVAALGLTGLSASAGVVRPGETVVVSAADSVSIDGTVLAQTTVPFTISYQPGSTGQFIDFPGTVEGSLTSLVVRDTDRGTLLFVYDIDLDDTSLADASEASALTVEGFAASTGTIVEGAMDFESVLLASRNEDGSAVRLSSDDPGLGGAPRLIIDTDATAFDAGGTTRFFAGDELAVRTPDGPEQELVAGTAVIGGTFRPVVEGPAPAPNPIPLPPAAWSGIALLGAGALTRLRKRVFA